MNDFFALLVLGHLVGDYVLQNKWMAMNKNGNWYTCSIHCLIYTLAVSMFTYPVMHSFIVWPLIIFITHFPIDYWGLADKWLDFINGRSLGDFFKNGHKGIAADGCERTNYHILRGGFTSVVYTATDNTMHLVLMYFAAMLLL
jgi:hypothetical protein